jgi:ribosomal protein S18 acetylase RimI-like enzyme
MMVRPLAPPDLATLCPSLVELPLLRRYRHTAASLSEDLRTGVDRGESVMVAVDEDGTATGLAWFLTHATFGLAGYLRLIAVAGRAHRRGVGSILLGAFEDAVRARTRHASLLVSDFNIAAQRFYRRHGYDQVGVLPGLVLPDVDERIFWKRLAPSA